ncbi:hypothetical protein GCM10022198_15840 [Klugiella xanthotipulae]|uniref:Uncharacterized protein n=2 Tax=Klugiella xanthotipulae TaxID=244735 RepID=A0A543HH26_9MICO|nr:hypothetical protein FB466_2616 [Klugiella xanthotipulae]
MEVDYAELALVGQVVTRQQGHVTAIRAYVMNTCGIPSGEMGLLLQAVYPLSAAAVSLGGRALRAVESVVEWGARATHDTVDAYLAADVAAHQDFSRVMAELGESLRSYPDPREIPPTLGGAQSRAASTYGEMPAWGGGEGLKNLFGGSLADAQEGVSGWRGGSVGVVERSDASSYLVLPHPGETFVDDLRRGAAPLLGSVDWLAEQLLGFSILEECITTPLSGDWQAIGSAAGGWSHAGRALREVAGNLSQLPEQVTTWQGRAADAFRATILTVSEAVVGLSAACDDVSGLLSAIGSVAQEACALIAQLLELIAEKLLRLALEASVPGVGGVVTGGDTLSGVREIRGWVTKINRALSLILDAIEGFADAREKLLPAVRVLEDLAEYVGQKTAGSVVS